MSMFNRHLYYSITQEPVPSTARQHNYKQFVNERFYAWDIIQNGRRDLKNFESQFAYMSYQALLLTPLIEVQISRLPLLNLVVRHATKGKGSRRLINNQFPQKHNISQINNLQSVARFLRFRPPSWNLSWFQRWFASRRGNLGMVE